MDKSGTNLGPVDLRSDVLPSQMGYSHTSTIVAFHIFHISLFVNTTAMVVNTYAILHMCVEIIICQSERFPWKVDDISNPWHGGTSNWLRWENECGWNSPSFWVEFCKTFPSPNGIFLTFQNCGICIFDISLFVNTIAIGVNSYIVQHMWMEVISCQADRYP